MPGGAEFLPSTAGVHQTSTILKIRRMVEVESDFCKKGHVFIPTRFSCFV